jgi:hypothetical protein
VVLVIGKALNVKDLLDVGRKGNKENKATEFMLKGKSEQEKKENKMKVRDLLTKEHSESLRKIRSLTDAEDEDDFDFDSWGPSSENEESRLDVEMTTTHRHRAHQSVAEAILPARISIIPRDSRGPEMAPSRLSLDGVVDPHRPSILALSSHHHHVLQAHGHLNALHHQQQHSSPDPNPNPYPGSGRQGQGQGQRIHIQRGQSTDGTTSPLAARRCAAPSVAPQGSPLQNFSRLPSSSADPAQTAVTVVHRAPVLVSSMAPSREDNAGATDTIPYPRQFTKLKFSGTKYEPHSRTHG